MILDNQAVLVAAPSCIKMAQGRLWRYASAVGVLVHIVKKTDLLDSSLTPVLRLPSLWPYHLTLLPLSASPTIALGGPRVEGTPLDFKLTWVASW